MATSMMSSKLSKKASEDLWEAALKRIEKDDHHQLAFGRLADIDVLSDLQTLTAHAKEECIRKRWRVRRPDNGETVILRDLFGKIVTWINLFKQIGDNAVQYDPQHASLPWAGIRFVLQVAVSDIVKFDFVVEGVEAMARMISRYAIFEDLYLRYSSQASENLKKALIGLYTAILLYLYKAKAFFQQSTPKRMLKGVFIAEEEFQELSKKISVEESEVDRCAVIVQTEKHNSMGSTLDALSIIGETRHTELLHILHTIDGPISRMDVQLRGLEDRLETSKRTEMLSWISSQPYIEHHERIQRTDVPGRGKWLLEDPVYTSWHKNSTCSLVWLHGKVGSGKSTLTAIVVDDAFSRSANGHNPPPVYFYCSRNAAEPERADPDAILASIVRQLSCIMEGAPLGQSIAQKFERKGQGFRSSGLRLKESRDIILELVEQLPVTTIVIDALDEIATDKRFALLQVLEDILLEADGLVKVFVSSRDDQDIVCTLREYPNLDLASDKNQSDIELFVRTETERLISRRRLLRYSNCRDELKSLIIERVSKGADGMFRWAVLQLEVLCTLKLDADVRTALGRLPPRLEELYADIYEKQVSLHHGAIGRSTICNILKWLLSAQTQMSSFEFRRAVAMNLPISIDELTIEHILDLCHNFIVFDDAFDTFRFTHLSVREFLETRAEYVPVACHIFAGELCLIQLIGSTRSSNARNLLKTEYDVDVSSKVAGTSESMVGSFHNYSTLYWMKHCAIIGEDARQSHARFHKLFRFFLSTDRGDISPLDVWMRSYRHREYDEHAPYYLRQALNEYLSPLITPFFLACAFGICEVVRESLTNAHLGLEERRTAWDIAVFGEQDDVLKILLTHRRDCDVPADFVEKVALRMKAKTLAWVLLEAPNPPLTVYLVTSALMNRHAEHSGKIDVIFNHYGSSSVTEDILATAAAALSGSTFQALLDQRSDIKVSERMFKRAVQGENHEVVRLLVDRQDFQPTVTALEDTVHICNYEILQVMLDRGALDITPKTMRRAPANEDTRVLQLLLDSGGIVSHSVLVAAAAFGLAPSLRMLLDRDRTVSRAMLRMGVCNRRDSEAVTTLLLAEADEAMIRNEMNWMMKKAAGMAYYRSTSVIKLLVDRARGISISEDVFMAATWDNSQVTSVMKTLLGDSVRSSLTVEVLEALAETLGSYESVRLLMGHCDLLNVDERFLGAAARNHQFGDELLKLMMNMTSAACVTETVWNAAAANEGCGLEIVILLEEFVGQINITEKLLATTASEGAPRTMAFLLDHSSCAEVTENVIASALKRRVLGFWTERTMVRLLLERTNDSILSEELLHQAARNSSVEIFQSIWTRCQEPKVSSALIRAAASNKQDWKPFKFLLEKTKTENLPLGEDILEAIIDGQIDTGEFLNFCFEGKPSLIITSNVLMKAAGNPSVSGLQMNSLLEQAKDIAISDGFFQNAAAAGHNEHLSTLAHLCGMNEVLPRWTDIAKLHDAAAQRAWYFEHDAFRLDTNPCDPDTDISLVKDLLSRHTPFDLPDGNGSTPLALAAKAGNELIANALLDAGADPDSRDKRGRSPLFNAVSEGHYSIAVAVLGKGVDKNIVDSRGETMVVRAKRRAHMEVYRMLEKYN